LAQRQTTHESKNKTVLTRTGLLMEGVGRRSKADYWSQANFPTSRAVLLAVNANAGLPIGGR
jgi:hypothetical protein